MANEKRLIDANALLEDFGEEPMVWNDSEAEIQERNDWRTYTRMVQNAPTVDAVEVVHGRWERRVVDHELPYYFVNDCSICGCSGEDFYFYCPNCGAKMDGDGND